MKNFGILILLLTCSLAVNAQGLIWIDVSYKVVLNPATGLRPPGVTNAGIDEAIAEMNALQETYFRGFRFRRVDPITDVGGLNQFSNSPSQWYSTDFFDVDGAKDQMEAAAVANPGQYAWNNNAINLYITNGICGGICSFPGGGDDIIIIGACSDADGGLHLHEIGHYFDLCHTQGCPCGSCDATKSGTCHTTPGDDGVDDTLPDLECWNQNNIALNTYGSLYGALSAGQQNQVDNVFFNVMSYHGSFIRMTELQLDRWTNTANNARAGVVDRLSIFVGKYGILFFELGNSVFPFITVQGGVNVAPAGSVLMVKPGAYNETMTISKPMSIRATRAGVVTIGSGAIVLSKQTEEALAAIADSIELSLEEALASKYSVGDQVYLGFAGMNTPVDRSGVEEVGFEGFTMYPNPNHGIFTVEIDPKFLQENSDAKVTIYTLQGEAIYRASADQSHIDVDLSTQPKGVYYVKLTGARGETLIKKLIYQ